MLLLRQHLEIYYSDTRLTFLVVFIDFFVSHSGNARPIFNPTFLLLEDGPALQVLDETRLTVSASYFHNPKDYFRIIYNFLWDPARSGKYAIDGGKYATAAVQCLIFLSNDRPATPASSANIIPPPDVSREKHALECLAYFLDWAERTEELVGFCHRCTFGPRSQKSPEQYRAAESAVSNFLQKVEGSKGRKKRKRIQALWGT